jgi:FkbM family methyltransferase
MTDSAWPLWPFAALVLLALAAIAFLKIPRLRLLIPFWSHIRFLLCYVLGRRPPLPFGVMYRGCFAQGDQKKVRDGIEGRSRLLQTDSQGFSQWEIPAGKFWIPPGANPHFLFGVFAEQDRDVYNMGDFPIRPGDVVVDCGANVGAFVHKALSRGARLVVAVEISPNTAECLRRSYAQEIADGRVIVYPKGMWHREDTLLLRVHPENSGENTVVMDPKGGAAGPEVPLTTIDNMVRELKLAKVDFIKMDIEGAEQNALRGAKETIAKFHPRLALTAYHLPEDVVKIPETARSAWAGYAMSCGPCDVIDGRIRPEILYFS